MGKIVGGKIVVGKIAPTFNMYCLSLFCFVLFVSVWARHMFYLCDSISDELPMDRHVAAPANL